MADYQQLNDPMTGQISGTVRRRADNAFIPDDPANRDRQTYLQWLDEGNVPDEPDPPPDPGPPTPDANARLDAGIEAARLAAEGADQMAKGVSTRSEDDPVNQGQLAALQAQVTRIEAAVTAMLQAQAGPMPRRGV